MSEQETLKNLYRQLEKVKAEARERYNEGGVRIDRADLQERIVQSRYLIDFKELEIDREWLAGLFREYLLTLKKLTEDAEVVHKLEQGFQRGELDLQELVKKVFGFDSDYLETWARKLGVEVEDLFYWGLRLGTPVFELYAARLKEKIDSDKWSKGYCPVCGSPPAMAYLRHDDGKRILWCRFCGTQWSFLRLKCPFCSNEDQDTLRYFFTDEEGPYRVYVCDKCKKYVKTIDQRKLKEQARLDLAWEDMETITLDVLAQKDGYSALPARL